MDREIAVRDRRLCIHQRGELGISGCVWDSALTLVFHIGDQARDWRGVRCLELGAGTGLGGLAAAVLGAHVTITDRGDAVQLIQSNIEANMAAIERAGGSARAAELDWLANSPTTLGCFDVLLASDCVYEPAFYSPLVSTLLRHSHDASVALIAQEKRKQRELAFWRELHQHFALLRVETAEMDDDYKCTEIAVFEARKRPQPSELDIEPLDGDTYFSEPFHDHLWPVKQP